MWAQWFLSRLRVVLHLPTTAAAVEIRKTALFLSQEHCLVGCEVAEIFSGVDYRALACLDALRFGEFSLV